jgi:predicted AAA+ superfamily ATPase
VRTFNTEGPCNPKFHYTLPIEPRLPEIRGLIDASSYIVLHAPRQSGKTTLVRTLAERLTAEGKFAALYVSCEEATKLQTDDVRESQRRLLEAIADEAADALPAELRPPEWRDPP